ncbi:MAG: hypothetical protein CPDRYMAC_5874 [uncultured Paraburkholderia sp.]|nr:MAG: hypothetical protein CPDRYDRY_5839 [uncultured Paraburkholderia sp.]CAH2942780.1 MAG: hypothetical protein CPDRYMAC_5874 [uncultured Paraburkholderia sp.]
MISKSSKKPRQRASDLGRRGALGREDKPVARRIKGSPRNRIGQVFGCRLLLANKLIQGLRQW